MGEAAQKIDPIVCPRCDRCNCIMRLIMVSPGASRGYDQRTFECAACLKQTTIDVKFA